MHCLLFNFDRRLAQNARALGCYRIAHFVREHGWDAEVVEYAAGWDLDRLKALARSRITKDTRWIGTSHMFAVWGDVMEEFCMWIKHQYPWICIISGSAANPAFESRAIDYYVQGYGEYALLVLLKYLFSNGPVPVFNLLSANARKVIPAISAYPAYPMRSLMVKYQDRDFILPGEWLGVEFSRGCKFSCAHCNFPVLGVKGDYTRDAADFREQIMDAYDRWGIQGYYVSDETFNDRTEKITKFADVVDTLPFRPWFSGYIRADLLVSRPLDQIELARMGFRGHYYGIESFHQSAARAIGKGMDPDRLKDGILAVKDYFESTGNGLYRGEMSFIFGLPGESIADIQHTLDWLDKNWNGQHVVGYPLALFRSDLDKQSRLSQTYQDQGYTEMTDDELASEVACGREAKFHIYRGDIMDGSRFIMWKNQHMNVFDASEIEEQVFEKYNDKTGSHGHKLGVWRLASTLLHGYDVESRLTVNEPKMTQLFDQRQRTIVENYIHNKLSI